MMCLMCCIWSVATGPLAQELLECFGLQLASNRHENNIHMFQLFLAAQFYTGCEFKDKADYCLADSRVTHPFQFSDIHTSSQENYGFSTPISKTFAANVVIPGPLGKLCSPNSLIGESLLACGLYRDAIHAFRIRLSVMNVLSRGQLSSKTLKNVTAYGHILYLLALALHLSGSEENNVEAKELLTEHLSCNAKYTAIAGRMMSLLATIHIRLGDYNEAMLAFDAGSTVFSQCFGKNHPILAVHMCSLADAYRLFSGAAGAKQARVMLTLAADLSRNCLGAMHATTTGYNHKLAILCIEQRAFEEALLLLQVCMQSYADLSKINNDVIECLYLQAVCCTEMKLFEDAARICAQVFDLSAIEAASNGSNSPGKKSLQGTEIAPSARSVLCAAELSAMVLMGDLCIRNKDLVASTQYLSRALKSLHEAVVNQVNIGVSAAKLTAKVLNLSLAKLSRQTRTFVETVAMETIAESAIDKSMLKIEDSIIDLRAHPDWSDRLNELIDDLWGQNPELVLDKLIQRSLDHEQG